MIKFENVSKKFKDTKVLKDISFDIEKGQLVVLIGLSGCGKTTTLKMINKLIKPTTGRIIIDGEDISRKDPIELRRNIGYVIQ
ncbi:ATP-binding cassette domain-containing protein, partial [Proteiniclasticum ruminis]|uniref:ATP-binding cassette domain-containing protein n=1 Tax=Proteiniclasticum ruminis TaxID=398199 RepID=UPI0028A24A4F